MHLGSGRMGLKNSTFSVDLQQHVEQSAIGFLFGQVVMTARRKKKTIKLLIHLCCIVTYLWECKYRDEYSPTAAR